MEFTARHQIQTAEREAVPERQKKEEEEALPDSNFLSLWTLWERESVRTFARALKGLSQESDGPVLRCGVGGPTACQQTPERMNGSGAHFIWTAYRDIQGMIAKPTWGIEQAREGDSWSDMSSRA